MNWRLARLLVPRTQDGSADFFVLHRLVRLLVLGDIGEESSAWDSAFVCALHSTHTCLVTCLKYNGLTFHDEPKLHDNAQIAFIPHTHAIATNYHSERTFRQDSYSVDIFVFSGTYMRWCGLIQEAANIFENLLEVRYFIFGTAVVHPSIANALVELALVYNIQGNLHQAEATLRRTFK